MLELTSGLVDPALRLLAATVVGMIIGLDRDLSGKPMGTRTFGLVSLGAALASVAAIRYADLEAHPDALSRVVQGILQGVLTGVGFLGAGVVLRDPERQDVHGLTTAASVWLAASLGIACALAAWDLVLIGVGLTLILLVVLKPVERLIVRAFGEPRAKERIDGGGPGEEG